MELNNEVFWKDQDQSKPKITMENEDPKPEKIERGNGENDRPHKGDSQQGEDDDAPNIPGPNELPDQQKVGEDVDDDTFRKDHIET
jgi:hypothetical protein